ncbi:MAG: CDF family Co(II)/Ni(II) efflux transporter DmeF [Candidatus Binatia bacterium]
MQDKATTQPCAVYEEPPGSERNERRTLVVVGFTAIMMVVEIVVGTLSGSLALTADGWHMATHVGALGLSAFAYRFARTRARAQHFTFGTGKVGALAGYTSAIFLIGVAVLMIVEAVERTLSPVPLRFTEALPVAVLGLLVNVVSAKLLNPDGGLHTDDDHAGHHDHNIRAAYFHVVADALTSVLAIVAIVGSHYAGLTMLDPLAAVVGGGVIIYWGISLCRNAASQLLDVVSSAEIEQSIRTQIEALADSRVVDLHLWSLGAGRLGCIVSIVARNPRPVAEYRTAILQAIPIDHLTVEVGYPSQHKAA